MNNFKVAFVEGSVLRPLRHKILRTGFPYESTYYEGDEDEKTAHAAVFDDQGNVIAIGTIMVSAYEAEPACSAFQLRGMAVDENYQGQGAGKLALDALEMKARAGLAEIMWCKARTTAAGFYERNGWVKVSEEFELPDFGPHFMMLKKLT